jgi:tetratricopeptide (TPR) repeat protein
MSRSPYQNLFRKIAVLVGAFLFASVAGWSQTTTIEGEVKGEDGKPIKDAIVKIERLDIKGNYKTKSDKKGHFIHAGLPIGTYKVSLEVGGKEVDSVNNFRTRLGDNPPIVFNMQEIKQRQDAMASAAATGQLTQEQERGLTREQKAALEKQMKERQAAMAKNKELNDAFNAGREALNAKQYDVAAQSLEKAGELDPNQHVVWAHLADAYSGIAATKTGDEQTAAYEKAIAAFGKAVTLKPDDAAYLNNYGLLLARAKKVQEAEAELTKAAQLDPPQAGKYYYNLGAVLQNTGQYEAAISAFKKAIDADPSHAEAQYWYATALSSRITMSADGKVQAPPGMKEALERYLELKPDGQFAGPAKELLGTIGGAISTTYENPNAPKKKSSGKKK